MDAWEFASSAIASLAWPTAAVSLGVLIRRPLTSLLSSSTIKRWKVGPGGVEIEQWDRQAERAREDLEPVPGSASGGPDTSEIYGDSLLALADVSPATAILEGFKRIEDRLRRMVGERGMSSVEHLDAGELIREALHSGVINSQTAHAIGGLQVLRDLAAHGSAPERLDAARARDYAAMVNAILFAMSRPPAPSAD